MESSGKGSGHEDEGNDDRNDERNDYTNHIHVKLEASEMPHVKQPEMPKEPVEARYNLETNGDIITCPICNLDIPQCNIRAINIIRQQEGSRTLFVYDEVICSDMAQIHELVNATLEPLTSLETPGWTPLQDERSYCQVALHFTRNHDQDTIVSLHNFDYDGSRPTLPPAEFRGGHSHGKIPLDVRKCPFGDCFSGGGDTPLSTAKLFTKASAFASHFAQSHCRAMHFICSACFSEQNLNPRTKGPTGLLRTRCTARTHFNRDNPERHGRATAPGITKREMRRKKPRIDLAAGSSSEHEEPTVFVRQRGTVKAQPKPTPKPKPLKVAPEAASQVVPTPFAHSGALLFPQGLPVASTSPTVVPTMLPESLHQMTAQMLANPKPQVPSMRQPVIQPLPPHMMPHMPYMMPYMQPMPMQYPPYMPEPWTSHPYLSNSAWVPPSTTSLPYAPYVHAGYPGLQAQAPHVSQVPHPMPMMPPHVIPIHMPPTIGPEPLQTVIPPVPIIKDDQP